MRHLHAWLLGLLIAAALPAGARAQAPQPRSIEECERIKGDLAYNQCLSLFGPAAPTKAGVLAAGQSPEAATPAGVTDSGTGYRPRRRGGRAYRRGGRQRAVFAVGQGTRSPMRRGRRRRH